jgi:hypothetical protein
VRVLREVGLVDVRGNRGQVKSCEPEGFDDCQSSPSTLAPPDHLAQWIAAFLRAAHARADQRNPRIRS